MIKICIYILTSIIFIGCSSETTSITMSKKDAESYAIASCLTLQDSPYLKDQGDAWASVIVQRMNGPLDALSKISEVVKEEIAKGQMAVIRTEGLVSKDKTLPIFYCNEIIYKLNVRAVIKDILETSV